MSYHAFGALWRCCSAGFRTLCGSVSVCETNARMRQSVWTAAVGPKRVKLVYRRSGSSRLGRPPSYPSWRSVFPPPSPSRKTLGESVPRRGVPFCLSAVSQRESASVSWGERTHVGVSKGERTPAARPRSRPRDLRDYNCLSNPAMNPRRLARRSGHWQGRHPPRRRYPVSALRQDLAGDPPAGGSRIASDERGAPALNGAPLAPSTRRPPP